MTVADLRCDRCGTPLAGPAGLDHVPGRLAVGFTYHPGVPSLRDDSGLACLPCWGEMAAWLGGRGGLPETCTRCGDDLTDGRLVVLERGVLGAWVLCRLDAIELLNSLRTVEPKLDPETFCFPARPEGDEAPH